MKKALLLALCLLMGVSLLTGCEKEQIQEEVDPIPSYDGETVFKPEVSGEESGTAVSGEITVRDKKYDFEGNNIVILNVENHTEENYVFTVTGTYLGANGEVLQTETQSFDQLAAGHEHFFLFQPQMQFEKFEYTFSVEETDAVMYINNLEFVFGGLDEAEWTVNELALQGDLTFYPMIRALCGYKNTSTDGTKLRAMGHAVVMNDREQVLAIILVGKRVLPDGKPNYTTMEIYYVTEGELVWPEELKGEVYAIGAITSVTKEEDPT